MAAKNNLKEIRTKEGLSLTELSRLSNISTTTLRHIENHKKTTTPVTKNKIVNGLNTNPNRTKIYTYEEIFPNG